MGTTLTNGIYLPNEGEKNCYAGLKTNWEILDQKIADIAALQQAVAGALHREIVASLPTTDIDPNTIYMILSGTSATENVYDEFMYVNNAWELIGTSATDLTNYYTKGDVDGLLVLKANASDLTSHTGDTTIHVTSADKTKWNTVALIKQLRLVNAQVGSATTIAFANIDDTNGIKVGDKCMDLDAKMFEITAVDTTNETVTVGSALIDLALDANVVHTSGNESIGGTKTFSDLQIIAYGTQYKGARDAYILPEFSAGYSGLSITTLSYPQTLKIGNFVLDANNKPSLDTSKGYIQIATGENNGVNACTLESRNSTSSFLGTSANKWSKIYGTEYYYGSNNVEFSTKFVTTDTAQTISGNKTFSSNVNVYNSDTSASTPNFTLRSSKSARGTSDTDNQGIFFNDKNNDTLASLRVLNYTLNGSTYFTQVINTKDTNDQILSASLSFYILNNGRKVFRPDIDNDVLLGYSSNKWKDVNTYLVNGLTPSSLGMPVAPSSTSYVDISGYITVLDSSAPNTYTPPSNGYITFNVTGNLVQIFHDYGLQGKWTVQTGNANRGFIPVLGGVEVKIYITASNVDKFWFIPCQGNI